MAALSMGAKGAFTPSGLPAAIGDGQMRYMIIVKATADSEAGVMPHSASAE